MKEIIFTNTINALEEFAPKPASSATLDWYKNCDVRGEAYVEASE